MQDCIDCGTKTTTNEFGFCPSCATCGTCGMLAETMRVWWQEGEDDPADANDRPAHFYCTYCGQAREVDGSRPLPSSNVRIRVRVGSDFWTNQETEGVDTEASLAAYCAALRWLLLAWHPGADVSVKPGLPNETQDVIESDGGDFEALQASVKDGMQEVFSGLPGYSWLRLLAPVQ